ncbi:MAG: tryptophan synthase subunit alpha [Armatimonadota bacterium]|nr:tryptophan synthase subunit alpha [Armatimonadota bacterium]MDR7451027.1 tryptophan synthase subunit alpha [Armatimonadota bacterium]MDR7465952.1 tryptophan synthase subunit alpha [Armatimonadota bacterium]MDR7494017.1 tryptophan synthase subunit alpha [Armatimonadota bacterium]MDR7498467.1 tryptophan synthase subunit alpha [Armatimonadota bacterium]
MSRIGATFERLRLRRRPAFIPFIVAGDPDLHTTARVVEMLVDAGADLIELGVPFSDPVADGPTNQRAYQRALAAGTRLTDVLTLVGELRRRMDIPVVLLSYYNPILQFGPASFCVEAVRRGVDGVVVPDLPSDEADELLAPARQCGLDTIFLLAPTSTDERIRLVAERCTGFVYCVSLTGITGMRDRLSGDLPDLVARIRARTRLPICVGFGVSTPEQAREVGAVADGVIVGSAIVALLERSDGPARARELAASLRRALDGPPGGKAAP